MERVTALGLNSTLLSANQKTLGRLAQFQEQLSTNKRINRVSDDPAGARLAMRMRVDSLALGKYQDNVEKASSFLDASDNAFSEMGQVLDTAKAFALQGANGSQDASSRASLAASVDSLINRMVDLGNTVHDGRYLFAGTATTQATPPFARSAADDGVDYRGTLDSFTVAIGPSSSVVVNQDGHSLFQDPQDVFGVLVDLREALKANDPTAINALIAGVDQVSVHVNGLQGDLGGRQQRLDLARNQLELTRTQIDGLVADTEDADLPEIMTKMNMTQVALQAGLQTAGKVLQTTLVDFLR